MENDPFFCKTCGQHVPPHRMDKVNTNVEEVKPTEAVYDRDAINELRESFGRTTMQLELANKCLEMLGQTSPAANAILNDAKETIAKWDELNGAKREGE